MQEKLEKYNKEHADIMRSVNKVQRYLNAD